VTLQPYSPEMLDQLALELLDLAAILHKMAQRARECQIDQFAMHYKKARQWTAGIARWARKAQAELELRVIEARADQRAATAPRASLLNPEAPARHRAKPKQ